MPSTASLHSAHNSVYEVPTSRVIDQLPFNVMIGAVVSSITTVLVTVVATFPLLSV